MGRQQQGGERRHRGGLRRHQGRHRGPGEDRERAAPPLHGLHRRRELPELHRPASPKLDAMEEVMPDRLTIPELEALIGELKTLAAADNTILNRAVVELLIAKTSNSKSLGDAGGLPPDWATFVQSDYERMVSNLDVNNEGSIDYRTLAVCLILLRSDMPNEKQLETLEVELGKQTTNCLAGVKLWCEATESSKDRDYSHEFNRIAMIKDIILSVFHDGT